jgi:hypothetical protein
MADTFGVCTMDTLGIKYVVNGALEGAKWRYICGCSEEKGLIAKTDGPASGDCGTAIRGTTAGEVTLVGLLSLASAPSTPRRTPP